MNFFDLCVCREVTDGVMCYCCLRCCVFNMGVGDCVELGTGGREGEAKQRPISFEGLALYFGRFIYFCSFFCLRCFLRPIHCCQYTSVQPRAWYKSVSLNLSL